MTSLFGGLSCRDSFDGSLPWLIPLLLKAQAERLRQVLRHKDVFGIRKGLQDVIVVQESIPLAL